MYAVIRSGGKQERVAEGQRVRVELLGQPVGAEVSLEPVLVVDGATVLATPEQLAGELRGVGFHRVEQIDSEKLNELYFRGRSDGLELPSPGLGMMAVAWV